MSTAASKDVAAAAVGTPVPDPKRNGQLLKFKDAPQIYLILNGYRCWIPDMATLTNLFASGTQAKDDPNLGDIAEGAPITSGAVLAKASGSDPIYLVTNFQKMWIPNPTIFGQYHFNSSKVQSVAPVLLQFISNGPDVQAPTT